MDQEFFTSFFPQVAHFSPEFLLMKLISQLMIEIFLLLFPLVDRKEAKLIPCYKVTSKTGFKTYWINDNWGTPSTSKKYVGHTNSNCWNS